MREFIATVTSKGRVTLPVEIREHLGIAAGETIVFVIDDEGSVRIQVPRYPTIASLRGAAGSLKQPLAWQDVKKIAHEDSFDGKDTDA